MKKIFSILVVLNIILLPFYSNAQDIDKAAAKPKTLSAKDKHAIIDIFNSIKPKYYLEFSKTEFYGDPGLVPSGLKNSIAQNLLKGETKAYHVYACFVSTNKDMEMWFAILSPQSATLEELLGKTNATRLQALINKYSGPSTDNKTKTEKS